MAAPVIASTMTTEELLAFPEDGIDRWLIRGHLREKPTTVRNRWHCRIQARIVQLLGNWLDQRPEPRGEIFDGDVVVRLTRDPDTTFGVDVVYISPELAAQDFKDTSLIDGIPVLAVEILSPSNTQEEIDEKVAAFLEAGVALVWVVNPHNRTVLVCRPNQPPVLFNHTQEISGEPELPGFRVPVAQIFRR